MKLVGEDVADHSTADIAWANVSHSNGVGVCRTSNSGRFAICHRDFQIGLQRYRVSIRSTVVGCVWII